MRNDFEEITHAITTASRAAFTHVLKNSDETFFAFALTTLSDATFVGASVNSLEAHQSRVETNGIDVPSGDEEYCRWSPSEWGEYEYIGQEYFKPVDQLLAAKYEEMSDDRFEEFVAGVLEAMQRALALLDAEGLWGTGTQRERVTLFVTVYEDEETIEDESAKSLNPPATYARFRERFAVAKQTAREQQQRSQEQRQKLELSVASLSVDEKVEHWIAELQQIAIACETYPLEISEPLGFLTEIGRPALMPILNFLEVLATDDTHHVDDLRYRVLLFLVGHIKKPGLEAHAKMVQLLGIYCRQNEGRDCWQKTPFHIARQLHAWFKEYPEPKMDGNNALSSHELFIEIGRKLTDK